MTVSTFAGKGHGGIVEVIFCPMNSTVHCPPQSGHVELMG
eukprot:CAMPEP_0171180536 /NCGR_PEP_ID=MMETSP0790-20130122/13806_1 /TAXON_ID=2925 /ORGANISM="Alexandrium catenella, Strain OF101" /LENGTH=39 /DNA_ID= /DNA_START= /DNA_END= /DNA_ORIENTATION=